MGHLRGSPPRSRRPQGVGPPYRPAVWQQALSTLGVDDRMLAGAMAEMLRREPESRGHRLIEGADALVRSLAVAGPLGLLTNGPTGHSTSQGGGDGSGPLLRCRRHLGRGRGGQARTRPFSPPRSTGWGPRPRAPSWSATAGSATWSVPDSWGCRRSGWPAGRPRPDDRTGVTVVDHVGQLTLSTTSESRTVRRRDGQGAASRRPTPSRSWRRQTKRRPRPVLADGRHFDVDQPRLEALRHGPGCRPGRSRDRPPSGARPTRRRPRDRGPAPPGRVPSPGPGPGGERR